MSNADFEELCKACRIGDFDLADRLISTGINVNGVDRFDNSPLFLASLCGHEEVVKLLLARGAVCDRDRFEGARCIYGALTDSIRDILLSYDISKAVDVNQPFANHISWILKDRSYATPDLSLSTRGSQLLEAHKFLLSVQCPKFAELLNADWNDRSEVDLSSTMSFITLETLLKYLYLVPVLHEVKISQYDELIRAAEYLGLSDLQHYLERVYHIVDPSEKSALMKDYQFKVTEDARDRLTSFVDREIIDKAVIYESECLVDASDLTNRFTSGTAFPDILLAVTNNRGEIKVYPCHLATLIRLKYFKVMFTHKFMESLLYGARSHATGKSNLPLPIISLTNCEFEVVESILHYIYHDSSGISFEQAIDVLLIADELLEDRLKSIAASILTQSSRLTEKFSIFKILRIAWDTKVDRLEQFAAKFIASNIQDYAHSEDLLDAIEQSSRRISTRQETDTVELADDIRYYLLKKYLLEPDDIGYIMENGDQVERETLAEYEKDMDIISGILVKLGLEI